MHGLDIFAHHGSQQIVGKVLYINEEEAREKLIKCLFHKAPIKASLLADSRLFEDLEEGLELKQKRWLRDKRDQLLDIAERIKEK